MITLPLLIVLGLPANVANGTNRVAILIQNVSAVLGFRSKGVTPWRTALKLCLPTCAGAVAGSSLAVELAPEVLEKIFGVVLIFLCGAVFLRPGRAGKPAEVPVAGAAPLSLKTFGIFFVVGFWGGFAHVGVGFLFLGGLILCSDLNLVHANAVKVLVILAYTLFSLAVFLTHHQVQLLPGLVMAAGNASGAWTASVLSVKKGAAWVRSILIAAALLASLKLLGVWAMIWNGVQALFP
jgi:uncharacterized membrane protein YfcA